MEQLHDHYQKSGLVPVAQQRLVRCEGCGFGFHPDDLNTVDVENYGEHSTIEVCDDCKADPDPVELTDADFNIFSANDQAQTSP